MPKESSLVSVVVITYNSSKYVIDTLNSIKRQTYGAIELIVTDDASSDDTVKICNEWLLENRDRFVRTSLILSKKNTGMAPNCNRGVLDVKGEWVKIIAGDDVLMDDCILKNIEYVNRNSDCMVLFSKCKKFSNNPEFEKTVNAEDYRNKGDWAELTIEQQLRKLIDTCYPIAATQFTKRELYDLVGYYDERFPFMEDYPFYFKVLMNGVRLQFMDEYSVWYRVEYSILRSKTPSFRNKRFHESNRRFFYEYLLKLPIKNVRLLKWSHFLKLLRDEIGISVFFNRRNRITWYLSSLIRLLDPLLWIRFIKKKYV